MLKIFGLKFELFFFLYLYCLSNLGVDPHFGLSSVDQDLNFHRGQTVGQRRVHGDDGAARRRHEDLEIRFKSEINKKRLKWIPDFKRNQD